MGDSAFDIGSTSFSLRQERLLPPKPPILGDFEPEILA